MADGSVKDFMNNKGFKFVNNDEYGETYIDNSTSIVINDNSHKISLTDYENWKFMALDAEMIEFLYDICKMKGWINDESDI